jgi:threonyl-tRNA synthetase
VLPISDKFLPYAKEVEAELKKLEIRAETDERHEKIGKLIRDTELQKVPYMLVIGEKEMIDRSVAVRRHGQGDLGVESIADFAARVTKEVSDRTDKQ